MCINHKGISYICFMVKFNLFPWENGKEPYWVNPDNGLEWFIEEGLTKWCSRENVNNWPDLNAVCFFVVENKDGERNPLSRVLIDKETNGMLAERTSMEAMATLIDMLRVSKSYDEQD